MCIGAIPKTSRRTQVTGVIVYIEGTQNSQTREVTRGQWLTGLILSFLITTTSPRPKKSQSLSKGPNVFKVPILDWVPEKLPRDGSGSERFRLELPWDVSFTPTYNEHSHPGSKPGEMIFLLFLGKKMLNWIHSIRGPLRIYGVIILGVSWAF